MPRVWMVRLTNLSSTVYTSTWAGGPADMMYRRLCAGCVRPSFDGHRGSPQGFSHPHSIFTEFLSYFSWQRRRREKFLVKNWFSRKYGKTPPPITLAV